MFQVGILFQIQNLFQIRILFQILNLFQFFVQNIFLDIQNLFKQKKGKEAYLLGRIGSAHTESLPGGSDSLPQRAGHSSPLRATAVRWRDGSRHAMLGRNPLATTPGLLRGP
jgi:hypothetical protein